MASLFIKDQEAAALAAEVAALRGVTKTAAVIDALRKERDALRPPKTESGEELIARLDAWRKANPLPPPTGLKADKAFFDWLSGEEDIEDIR
jgi:antitoxin VapB